MLVIPLTLIAVRQLLKGRKHWLGLQGGSTGIGRSTQHRWQLREQNVPDKQDEIVDDFITRIDWLILFSMASTGPKTWTVALKCLRCLEKNLDTAGEEISKMDTAPTDDCLVHQHKEQLREFKHELCGISKSLAALNIGEKKKLTMLQTTLDAVIFDSSLKRMLEKSATYTTAHTMLPDNQVPKIDMPTFNGNIYASVGGAPEAYGSRHVCVCVSEWVSVSFREIVVSHISAIDES